MRSSATGVVLLAALALGGPAAAEDVQEQPGYYLVVVAPKSGPVDVRYAGVVSMRPRPSLSESAQAARLAGAARETARVAVTLLDAGGLVVFRDVVEVPRWVRGEFHAGEVSPAPIEAQRVATDRAVFVVRAPMVPDGLLVLEGGPVAERTAFSLEALADDPQRALPASSGAVVTSPVPPEPANRVDLLIMGDGFTSAQQAAFQNQVAQVTSSFFSITPYKEYRNYVSLTSLFTPSPQSGADQPPYSPPCTGSGRVWSCCADPDANGLPSLFVDTAFDGTFCSYGIQRLLTVDDAKALAAAAAVPDWDFILMVSNTATYGGSGGFISTFSAHALAIQIAQHEYGHSFSGLGDEYGGTAAPGCSDLAGPLPACEPNVTDVTTRASIKWNRWVAAAQPIPSSGPPPVATNAGLWEGAHYSDVGLYRQGYNCLMRTLGTPFCDVASEVYALTLYQGGWGVPAGGIDNIEPGTTSPAATVTLPSGAPRAFGAQILGPVQGASPLVSWYVDAGLVASGTVANGATASYVFVPGATGAHTVRLEAIDQSSILHPTMRAGVASNFTWNVTVAAPLTGDYDGDGKTDVVVFHPSSGLWYIKQSSTAQTVSLAFGGPGYTPVPRDYDGDGQTDVAAFHSATGLWFIRQSSTSSTISVGFGGPGYTPVPRDYDGDGKADMAVYHQASGLWFVRKSSDLATLTVGYGGPGFTPVARDYDGDGKADVAVYHEASGLWFVRKSSDLATLTVGYGGAGFAPVPHDYDGDGKADMAVYHEASGLWYLRRSSDLTTVAVGFGGSGFGPVPADYDGDHRADVAVYHGASGLWFIRRSTDSGTTTLGFGGAGFVPVND